MAERVPVLRDTVDSLLLGGKVLSGKVECI